MGSSATGMTTTTADRIRDETSIPKELRMLLAIHPAQELRPLQFTRHVQNSVKEFRRQGIDEISFWRPRNVTRF
jgi:hypothetical protein